MNGIVVLSLESGLLIYASNRLSSFGFIENGPVDAMQLSSTLFALYKAASESDDHSDTAKIAAAAIAAKVDPPPNKSLIVNDPSIAWVEQVRNLTVTTVVILMFVIDFDRGRLCGRSMMSLFGIRLKNIIFMSSS